MLLARMAYRFYERFLEKHSRPHNKKSIHGGLEIRILSSGGKNNISLVQFLPIKSTISLRHQASDTSAIYHNSFRFVVDKWCMKYSSPTFNDTCDLSVLTTKIIFSLFNFILGSRCSKWMIMEYRLFKSSAVNIANLCRLKTERELLRCTECIICISSFCFQLLGKHFRLES